MEIKIRKANLEDINSILEIVKSRSVSSCNLTAKTGLVNYPIPSKEQYNDRINNDLFYVAENEEKQIVSFIDCYNKKTLEKLFAEDPIVKELLLFEKSDLSYIETLVVRKGFEKFNTSISLFNELISNLNSDVNSLWASIIHKPMKNSSIVRAREWNFFLEKEISIPENLTFGLYKKKLI